MQIGQQKKTLKTDPFFEEVKRLRKKFPKLTYKQAVNLANQNLNPKTLNLAKKTDAKPVKKIVAKPVVKPTGKLMPKGKLKPQGVMQSDRLVTKQAPTVVEQETVIVKKENKGITIYLIIVAAAAAYYFLFKKKR
jgi:hypothetical protein